MYFPDEIDKKITYDILIKNIKPKQPPPKDGFIELKIRTSDLSKLKCRQEIKDDWGGKF